MTDKHQAELELELAFTGERINGAMFLIEGLMNVISTYNPMAEARMKDLYERYMTTMSTIAGEFQAAVDTLNQPQPEGKCDAS